MVCPNCKHELNPLARVCPTCGTPIPGTPGESIIVITPEAQLAAVTRKKRGPTAARVAAVILCVLAAVVSAAAAWLWFVPSLMVYADEPASMSLRSMFQLTYDAAPYLTYAVAALCAISVLFCLLAVRKKGADKRRRLLIPKLAVLGAAACYIAPFAYNGLVPGIWETITGWQAHVNFFTVALAGLFVVLCIAAELTIANRRKIQELEIGELTEKLASIGIRMKEEE